MKTLSENLKDIQTSNMSIKAKKEACLKIGLTPVDINVLEFSGFFKTAKKTVTKKITLTFGVEIECVVPRHRIDEKAALNGLPIQYEGYNHRDNRSYYKFVSDSSIHDDIQEGGCYNGIECVSPILNDNQTGHASLKNCIKTLNDANAQVNRSCGLHVHVGIDKLSGEQIVNIYKNYQMLESLIDSFMAPSRRTNCQWACSLRPYDFSDCHNAADVERRIGTRYCKVNPMAYYRHKTVEFRQHQGTTDFAKISNWVAFCTKLVAWSMENVLDHEINTIAEVPFLNASEREFFSGRINDFANR